MSPTHSTQGKAMKRMMKAGLMIALVASVGAALAGARARAEVYVDQRGRYADGNLVDARGSSDSLQRIGCLTYSSGRGFCVASDSTGNSAGCHSMDPGTLQVMRSLDSDSYLYFDWDENGVCTTVFVYKSSMYRPGSISGF
jgi:hypothetical protein